MNRQREYWAFYWPLAFMGAAAVLATQAQNGVLARYPDAVLELAIFAFAHGVFVLFSASLAFLPQLSTVFARDAAAMRRTLHLVIGIAVTLTLILQAIALTPIGHGLLAAVFGIDETLRLRVLAYLSLLAPILLIDAVRAWATGILVLHKRTLVVTNLNILALSITISLLVAGFTLGLEPSLVLAGAQAGASIVHAVGSLWLASATPAFRSPEGGEPPSVARLSRFFFPVATTGLMFALSRPVLFAFAARMPEGIALVAALRVGFDFTFLFQQAANQFRHFFVSFGLSDLPGKRRFLLYVGSGITVLMLATALTPVGDVVLRDAMGIQGDTLARAQDVILIMTLLPLTLAVRNYFHGILMVIERTGGMATAGVLRVIAIALLAWASAAWGFMDHNAAAWILMVGFWVETAMVWLRAHRYRNLWQGESLTPSTTA